MEWVRYHDIDDHFFHILRAVVCVIGAAIGFATYSYGEWTNNHGGAWWTAGAMGFGVVLIVASIVFALVTLFKWIGDEF
jgi:hypothetical protein